MIVFLVMLGIGHPTPIHKSDALIHSRPPGPPSEDVGGRRLSHSIPLPFFSDQGGDEWRTRATAGALRRQCPRAARVRVAMGAPAAAAHEVGDEPCAGAGEAPSCCSKSFLNVAIVYSRC